MIGIILIILGAGAIGLGIYIKREPFGTLKVDLKIGSGDTRVTTTQKYIITEECIGADGFGRPMWKKIDIKPREKEDEQD